MKPIYIDSEFKCHVSDSGTMTAIETGAFDDKCDAFIEGFCYDDSKGYTQIYPWKSYSILDQAQREYQKQINEENKQSLLELRVIL